MALTNPSTVSIAIIGAGAAGLITAYTLLQDGFRDVQIFTRDESPGGVWSRERVYPGLFINSVHGELRFSPMQMSSPSKASETGGRLSGEDVRQYMEQFAEEFLKDKIRYGTEVLNIERRESDGRWRITVWTNRTDSQEVLEFGKIVLCTGGCSTPFIPEKVSPSAAISAGFCGPVFHASQFRSKMSEILSSVGPISTASNGPHGSIVIVGGGKSAQDISAYLADQGRKVYVVFETADAFFGVTSPLPDALRKSRFLAIISPHIQLRTRLERFLHKTWLGAKIVHFIWNSIAQNSFAAFGIPKDSPLRRTHSIFWGIRTNDEGIGRPNGFHALVNAGKIDLITPARVQGFGEDGRSVILNNGTTLAADCVILCTGYTSSWSNLFSAKTADEIGIGRHPPKLDVPDEWNYASLSDPPHAHSRTQQWASSIYRGLVPAKNINHRDLAINGAVFTTNPGYIFEVSAHWISSYFLGDRMRLPASPEEAISHAERYGAWMRKRFPDTLLWINESYSSGLDFWTWPQKFDELLEDMMLPIIRSGGNWLTWPFKVIDVSEISTLKEERRANRERQ